MSNKLPSREQAIEILRRNHCPNRVIDHCQAVAALAVELAEQLNRNGLHVNVELVQAGALLHDLGRSKTHSVDHAVVGAEIAALNGLPQPVVSIIKRHVGAGITAQEAQWLGWPKDNYMPKTVEEKIVSYADKLIEGAKRVSVDLTIEQLQAEKKVEAAERVRKLHEEMQSLLGTKNDQVNFAGKSLQ